MRIGDEHVVQPGVVSVTQSTELGTLYTLGELRALAEHAHANGMLLHVDGARLANAAAALDVPLAAITTDVGADVVSFGGTKAGLMLGEAVVVLRPELAPALPYLRKQSMQLASKMRFVAAQFEALLEGERWRARGRARQRDGRAAGRRRRAASRASRSRSACRSTPCSPILPPGAAEALQREWGFYVWDEHTGEVRWMCSWDTRAGGRRRVRRRDRRGRLRMTVRDIALDRLGGDGGSRGPACSTATTSAARTSASRTATTTTSWCGCARARATPARRARVPVRAAAP